MAAAPCSMDDCQFIVSFRPIQETSSAITGIASGPSSPGGGAETRTVAALSQAIPAGPQTRKRTGILIGPQHVFVGKHRFQLHWPADIVVRRVHKQAPAQRAQPSRMASITPGFQSRQNLQTPSPVNA